MVLSLTLCSATTFKADFVECKVSEASLCEELKTLSYESCHVDLRSRERSVCSDIERKFFKDTQFR